MTVAEVEVDSFAKESYPPKDDHSSPKQSYNKIKNDNHIWTGIAAYMYNSSSLGAGIEGDSLTKALVVTSTWSSRRASNH